MLVDKNSTNPQVDNGSAKQTNLAEVFLSQICGESKSLDPVMLNDNLAHATESDWALSAILDVDYIQPLEEYCEQTQPCDVPITFPKLLSLIGLTISSELVPFAERLCEMLAEHVLHLKSIITEIPPTNATISANSTTLPEESQLLAGTTVLEMLCEGFSLLYSLLSGVDDTFRKIMIDCDFVPLLKSTIIEQTSQSKVKRLEGSSKYVYPFKAIATTYSNTEVPSAWEQAVDHRQFCIDLQNAVEEDEKRKSQLTSKRREKPQNKRTTISKTHTIQSTPTIHSSPPRDHANKPRRMLPDEGNSHIHQSEKKTKNHQHPSMGENVSFPDCRTAVFVVSIPNS
ncbi:hypothetical protein BLNAU_8614 [Blattamonas nauphoetae]|uniref:Uncharacterized protein n=1 Tax=Blattamonas nauphoetae TaxID=2049346 RepID=A0ABQ9XY55_9EUKA|nr:hypothetical protein BLNAU_8614 [Blattamonas nauphoetae]